MSVDIYPIFLRQMTTIVYLSNRPQVSMGYLVNKPLQTAGMSADNARGCPKNEHLAEKRTFEGKCEILSTISQPRTLSADIPASQKGVYFFITLPLIFILRSFPSIALRIPTAHNFTRH